jgi:hypothetical protein
MVGRSDPDLVLQGFDWTCLIMGNTVFESIFMPGQSSGEAER